MNERRVGIWSRIYGALLRLYPSSVGGDSRQGMAQVFDDLLLEARSRGRRSAAVFLLRACLDVIGSACQAWHSRMRFSRASLRSAPMNYQDLKFTLRQFRRSPAYVLVTVLSLAIGIGAATTVFSGLNALILRPSPGVARPETLVSVYTGSSDSPHGQNSLPDFKDWAAQADVFESAALFTVDIVTLGDDQGRRALLAESVTEDYFRVLRLQVQRGRVWGRPEAESGQAVAVISDRFWESEFERSPDAVGSRIVLNNRPFTVLGVAPAGFTSRVLSLRADVWIPMELPGWSSEEVQPDLLEDRSARAFLSIARLAPDVGLERAQAQLSVLAGRLREEHPQVWTDEKGESLLLTVGDGDDGLPPNARIALGGLMTFLMLPVGLVLIIACANVANLVLSRVSRRRREMALRLALGAGRWRLLRQMLLESVLLASAAGLLGLLAATWAAGSVRGLDLMGMPLAVDLSPDWRVFCFSLALALVSSLLFGLLPAWRSARPDLVPALKDESESSGMRLRRFSLRNALVVAQVAGCFVLLSGSLLFLRSQLAARGLDPGFRHEGLAVVRLDMSQFEPQSNPTTALERTRDFRRRLLARGEVAEVAYASSFPMSLAQHEVVVGVEGHQGPSAERRVKFNVVSPGYFDLLEIPLVAGRSLRPADSAGTPRVCLVNETFQRRFWPNQPALGKTLTRGEDQDPIEVAGIVRDHLVGLGFEPSQPAVWVPLQQSPDQGMLMAVVRPQGRASGDFLNMLRQEVESFTGRPEFLPPAWASEMIEVSLLPNLLASRFLGWTGALALVLALAGLYGVISYSVSLRRREMSIRMALGADRRSILSLVIRQGLSLTAAGFVLGIPAAIGFAALLSHLLYGLSPADPVTLVAIALLLSLCTLAATLTPALHAASTNPLRSLRTD